MSKVVAAAPARKKKNVSRHFAKQGGETKKSTEGKKGGVSRRPSEGSEMSLTRVIKEEPENEEWRRMSVKEVNGMKRKILERVYDNYLSVY